MVNRGIDRLLHGLSPDNDLVSWVGQDDGEHWQAPRSVADAAVHVPIDAAGGVIKTLTGLGRLTIGGGAMATAGEVTLSALQKLVSSARRRHAGGCPARGGRPEPRDRDVGHAHLPVLLRRGVPWWLVRRR